MSSGGLFVNPAPTPSVLGGVFKGETFPVPQTLSQMMNALIYANPDVMASNGVVIVETLAERDAIAASNRDFGLFCIVFNDPVPANNGTFQLQNIALGGVDNNVSNNANWKPYTSGSGDVPAIPVSLSGGKSLGKYVNGQTVPAFTAAQGGIIAQLADIAQETLFPSLVPPSNGAGTINVSLLQEVGVTIANITIGSTFNKGAINPQYSAASPFRSGNPNTHIFGGVAAFVGSIASTALSLTKTILNYVVVNGSNLFTTQVAYDAGVQPKDSAGNNFNSPLPAGNSNVVSQTITGQYPYFFGVSNTPPVAGQSLINSGTKVVADSNGTISVNFGATAQYLWFAIPQASTNKTKWFVNALNNGFIGSPTDLFNANVIASINSPSALWNGISYRIYISNFATTTSGVMQLQN